MAVDYLKMERLSQWCIVRGAKIGTTGAVSQYLILFVRLSTSRTGFTITALSSLNLFLYVNGDVYYEKFSLIKLSKVGWFVASSWNQKQHYFTEKFASSPGHSQLLMLQVEKRESLVAKSRAQIVDYAIPRSKKNK